MRRAVVAVLLVLLPGAAACGSSSNRAATTVSGPHRVATVTAARSAVTFPVPDPGTRLDKARLTRIVVGGPPDIGSPDRRHPVVTFFYSGGGIENARVEVGSPAGKFGQVLESSLRHDVGPRLVGPHFSAESEDDSYAFRCGGAIVLVSTYQPDHAAWKRVLTRVARDCPAAQKS
jgi:hypothetical protein